MKSFEIIFATLLGSASFLSAATNILSDPGFEGSTGGSQTNPSWAMNANQPSGGDFSAQYQTAPWASNAGGTPGTGVWLKAFTGNAVTGATVTVSQTVPAMAGLDYELSVWNKQEANYTAATTFFAVDFLDGAGTILSTELSEITTHPKDASWQEYKLMATAPAATAEVMVRVGMINGVDAMQNPQSAMFDDVTLSAETVVPEPSSALLAALGFSFGFLRRRRK